MADRDSPEAVERALKMQEGAVLAREVLRLRAQVLDTEGRLLDALVKNDELHSDHRAELELMRTRGETAAAAADLWGRIDHKIGGSRAELSELARRLDALARAHQDGGRDR